VDTSSVQKNLSAPERQPPPRTSNARPALARWRLEVDAVGAWGVYPEEEDLVLRAERLDELAVLRLVVVRGEHAKVGLAPARRAPWVKRRWIEVDCGVSMRTVAWAGERERERENEQQAGLQGQGAYLSRALAHSWRPRARPSFMRAVLMTSWRAVMTSILAGGPGSSTTGVSLRAKRSMVGERKMAAHAHVWGPHRQAAPRCQRCAP